MDVRLPWRKDTYELRIYGAYYVATASYTSNREQGLASLMGYIEGGNEDETTFPATQPLMMRYVEEDEEGGAGGQSLSKSMELSLGAGVSDPPAPTVPGGVGPPLTRFFAQLLSPDFVCFTFCHQCLTVYTTSIPNLTIDVKSSESNEKTSECMG